MEIGSLTGGWKELRRHNTPTHHHHQLLESSVSIFTRTAHTLNIHITIIPHIHARTYWWQTHTRSSTPPKNEEQRKSVMMHHILKHLHPSSRLQHLSLSAFCNLYFQEDAGLLLQLCVCDVATADMPTCAVCVVREGNGLSTLHPLLMNLPSPSRMTN